MTDSENSDQTGLESEITLAPAPLQFDLLSFQVSLSSLYPITYLPIPWTCKFQLNFFAFDVEYRNSSLNLVTFNAHFPNQLLIRKMKCTNTSMLFQTFSLSYFRFRNFHFTLDLTILITVP